MASWACSIFGMSIIAVLLAGYLGQKYLPPPPPKVLGIDLGTTYSCIGMYQAVTGDIWVIPNKEGHKCIPSIVAFSDNNVVVGYRASELVERNPSQTIYDAKRFIGQKMSIEELAAEGKRYPFKMRLDSNNDVVYDMALEKVHEGEELKLTVPPSTVTPAHIGAYIIQSLRLTAEKNLSVPVTKAVMAVPAEFSERQRNFTKQAAELAGVQVLRIINEPTAAALAYGLHKKTGVNLVMVVDLGGGTLDVSLMHIQGGMFVTVAMAGNSHLGGQDFTHRILRHFLDLIRAEFGESLRDPEDIQAVRTASENAKIQLTYNESATIKIPLRTFGGKIWTHKFHVQTFNKITEDLFQRVLEPIQRILSDQDLSEVEVDEIVLVGGSTRIPRVREIIRNFFQKDLNISIDPELAVTLGVSIQAGIIGGVWPLEVSALEVKNAVKKINID